LLPTFVIGLREGLEATLIIGIVAAFLTQQGRRDALRPMWLGVGAAVGLCVAGAVALEVFSAGLPQRRQEALETLVALAAVGMVTYMIVFMRNHAPRLREQLQADAGAALASGSARALIVMAFLAVLREGLETAVFVVATFQAATSPAAAASGAIVGILVAVVLGAAVYRGAVKINLARFFTATGLVLVLVAAGLVAFAAHAGHEAGWINIWQGRAVDLSGVVAPGSVLSALVTGVLGIQPRPVWAEVAAWLAYLVPMTLYVLWPRIRKGRPTGEVVQTMDLAETVPAGTGS
jgi:high-affinity iron transporter